MPIQTARCRTCVNKSLVPVLDLGEQALTGGFSRNAAERITRGPLQLLKCHGDVSDARSTS